MNSRVHFSIDFDGALKLFGYGKLIILLADGSIREADLEQINPFLTLRITIAPSPINFVLLNSGRDSSNAFVSAFVRLTFQIPIHFADDENVIRPCRAHAAVLEDHIAAITHPKEQRNVGLRRTVVVTDI